MEQSLDAVHANNGQFHEQPAISPGRQGVHYTTVRRKILDGARACSRTPAGPCAARDRRGGGRQLMELDYTPSFLRGIPKAL